ncbi:hypothetical protein [Streptomyces sp. NPDC059893]|uniref:hypothetical protein n=1 Tax=Streptomyces sp. NPDC059893 TaxID=3346990 RepID=UPI0036647F9F
MSREPDRGISRHLVDEEMHRYLNAELGAMSVFLDGRVTHELMLSVRPTADADPDCNEWTGSPSSGGTCRRSCFSRTLDDTGWNTTIVRDVVVEDILARKSGPAGTWRSAGPISRRPSWSTA